MKQPDVHTISSVTRHNILDVFRVGQRNWNGRCSEVEFLSCLYDLQALPSTDRRVQTAADDIWQHRIRNPEDWPDDWLYTDSRFHLLDGSDELFLQFLCQTLHPVVRSDPSEVTELLHAFNGHLAADGWELIKTDEISGYPIYSPRRVAGPLMKSTRTEPTAVGIVPSALRVFLCHSSGDKQTVRQLYRKLVADGIRPWLDEEDLLPGEDWDLAIRRAVRSSNAVIVCLSRGAVTKEGYVQKEIRQALDVADEKPEGTIFIIPVRFDDCDVPERLRKWQWVDASDGYDRLLRALRSRETAVADTAPTPKAQPAPLLTEPARELLVEASQDKSGTIMRLETLQGSHVQTNSREFVLPGDARSAARWRGAVDELNRYRLVEDRAGKGELFFVTDEGYRIADLLGRQQ